MGSIFKTILGIVITIVIVYCGIGILWANNEAVAAETYLHEIGNEISAANLKESVISECVTQVSENDYELHYEIVHDMDGYASYVNLTLDYKYTVSFISLSGTHTKKMTVY